MDSASQLSSTLIPPESKLAVSQISYLFSLLFSILHRAICSAAFMLNTANDQDRTVNHTPVTNLYRRLIVYFGRVGAYLNFIIVVQIALLIITVLGFHIRQYKDKRRVAAAVLIDRSSYSRSSQQVKFSVPTTRNSTYCFCVMRSCKSISSPTSISDALSTKRCPKKLTVYISIAITWKCHCSSF